MMTKFYNLLELILLASSLFPARSYSVREATLAGHTVCRAEPADEQTKKCRVQLPGRHMSVITCSALCLAMEECLGVFWDASAASPCHAKVCDVRETGLDMGDNCASLDRRVRFYAIESEHSSEESSQKDLGTPQSVPSSECGKSKKSANDCRTVLENTTGDIEIFTKIQPEGSCVAALTACSKTLEGDVITLVARRIKSSKLDFAKSWEDYVNGFYNTASKELWLGLEVLHFLSGSRRLTLEMCILSRFVRSHCYRYRNFKVSAVDQLYRFSYDSVGSTGSPDGHVEKCLYPKSGTPFSTPDKDHTAPHKFAEDAQTGWWFNAQGDCNPLGKPYMWVRKQDDPKFVRIKGAENHLIKSTYASIELRLIEEN